MKRKYYWTLEGLDDDLEPVFPQCVVKFNKDDIKKTENKIIVTQYFTMYDKPGEARSEFNKFIGCEDQVRICFLNRCNGYGKIVETYKLDDVTMKFDINSDVHDDYIVANWFINYKTLS